MRISSFSCLQQLLLTLIITVVSTTEAQEYPGFGGGGAAKPCPPHRCPKDQEPVPKWPLRLTSTGCSGLGGGLQMMSPGSVSDQNDPKDICCDLRHACFQTCGAMKTVCDEEFFKCSKRACAAMVHDDAQRKKCESSSSIHELMISMDKCQKYSAAQSAHCECVPTSRVTSRRTQVLEKFYKKYNPESIDKVPGLVAKVDSGRKMAGLLMQLYKKYPHAIKKIKDPTQEMMEKMMKDAEKMEETGSRKQAQDDVTVEESDAEDLGVDEL
ncbi:arachidonic acid secretion [Fragilaria crotonensis]|nr:arachidonic acid secretion [Fragilaria crotonensis]